VPREGRSFSTFSTLGWSLVHRYNSANSSLFPACRSFSLSSVNGGKLELTYNGCHKLVRRFIAFKQFFLGLNAVHLVKSSCTAKEIKVNPHTHRQSKGNQASDDRGREDHTRHSIWPQHEFGRIAPATRWHRNKLAPDLSQCNLIHCSKQRG
jgi:hypothetical protein